MADDSRNPQDAYRFNRLDKKLEGLSAEFRAEKADARARADKTQQALNRLDESKGRTRAAERESLARGARTRGATPAEEAVQTRRSASFADDLAKARARGATAAERQLAAERKINEVQRSRPTGGRVGGGGGGGEPPRPPAPPTGPPPGGGGRRPTGGYLEEAQAREARAAGATSRFSGNLRAAVAAGAPYDDSLRRHGALTTEFFDALKRGEVTFAEFRYQMGATIAKFAGWTAASVLVFAALDAVRQFGKGAIDASAGASQLQRYINDLDTSKAQSQFVDLAQQFNLPIADVADAFGRMGQVFHNQDQAFEATKSALYGVKVGNLDVADSTRYLLGIVRGFKQGPEELQATFDRINQAQNKFGVGIRDTSAGVAKAAGAWHAAGGDVNTLTSLITAGAAKTGRSGEEMGTAFGRMAEIIKRGTNQNKEQLKEFGIDASKPVDQVFHQAVELVRSGKVRGAAINRLAAALSTPQLSGRITPILQDPAFLDKVEATLARSKGSAARELHTTLKSAREELGKIGTNLQTLGAEFVRAGGAAPFAVMLKALNLALSTATDLLQVFNELPGPLKTVAVSALEIAGALKLLGRFGIGPGSLGNLLNNRGGSAVERRTATRTVEVAQAGAAHAQLAVQEAIYEQRLQAQIAAQARKTGATEVAAAAEEAEANAAKAAAAADRRLIAAEEELRIAMQGRTVATERAALAEAIPLAAGARGLPRGYAVGGRGLTAAERDAVAAAQGARPALGQRVVTAAESAAANNYAVRGAGYVVGAGAKAAGALGRMEASLARFAVAGGAMLGPIDLAIIAFLTLPPAFDAIKEAIKKAHAAAEHAADEPGSRAERDARAKGHKPGDRALDYLPGVQDYLAKNFSIGVTGAQEQRDQETAKLQIAVIDKLMTERYLGITRGPRAVRNRLYPPRPANNAFAPLGPVGPVGGPLPDLLPGGKGITRDTIPRPGKITISGLSTAEIRHNAAAAVSEFKRGIISRNEAMKLVDASIRDIRLSSSSQPKKDLAKVDLQKLRDSLGPGQGRSLKDIINALSDKEFAQRMQQDTQAIQALGLRRGRVRDIMLGYQTALARVKRHPTAGNIARFAAAQQAVQAEASRIDQDLQDDLKFATTAREREVAYRKALDKIAKDLPKGSRERRIAKHDTLVARFDDQFSTAQGREALGQAATRDPLDRARKALADNNADIARMRDAIRRGLKSEKDLQPLLLEHYQRADAVAQAAEAQFQAGQDLAAASYALAVHGDPGKIARHDVGQAQTNLAHAVASGDKTKILEAAAKLKQTKLALWQFIRDEAAAMIQANQAYAEAGIDPANIVALAELHVRTDRKDISQNRANTPSGRRTQDAKLKADRAEAARARQQTAYDDLSFAHDMGRITDQAYAQQLRALAKTIKHNKGLRRQLLLEAHNLEKAAQDDSGIDMNIGNIKLPTVYEIRRAMKGGAGPTKHQVQVQNNNRIEMTVSSEADVDAVFGRMDEITGSSLQAAGRSAGIF